MNKLLVLVQEQLLRPGPRTGPGPVDATVARRWFRRCRVSHLVASHRAAASVGEELGHWRDPALDRIIHHEIGAPETRSWSIVRVDDLFPEARAAVRARTAPDRSALLDRLSRSDERDVAWFLAEDRIPARPDARHARLTSWDGTTATVEHDGPCDLVLARTFDPGWLARVGDGPEQPVLPVDGGFLAVRLDGSGTHRVSVRYRTPRIVLWSTISIAAAGLNLAAALRFGRARALAVDRLRSHS